MCRWLMDKPAFRSYGVNLPMSAWGTVFPGDEAERLCARTGEACAGDCPLDDEAAEERGHLLRLNQ